ncbi:MAG: NosD domain-containing protein, partial [Phycisphaerales bacterium]
MESQTDRRAMLAAAAGLGGLAVLTRQAGAGPLTPPGAPASTGRTTTEIFDDVQAAGGSRIPVNTLPAGGGFQHQITQPGAYVLTANINTSGSAALLVSANDVDIDFNGFSLINTSSTSGPGVSVGSGFHRTRIHNGAIRGTFFALSLNDESIVERMRISGFGTRAIAIDNDCIVRDCLIRGGTGVQLTAGDRCLVVNSTFSGSSAIIAGSQFQIDRCTLETTTGANFGIQCGGISRVSNCIVRNYAVAGITVNDTSAVEGCVLNNNGDGIILNDNCLARGNNVDFHPQGVGIKIQGSRSRLVENHICRAATGIEATAGDNIAYGNTILDCSIIVNGPAGNSFPLTTFSLTDRKSTR